MEVEHQAGMTSKVNDKNDQPIPFKFFRIPKQIIIKAFELIDWKLRRNILKYMYCKSWQDGFEPGTKITNI
jgi:hypothetical protein